MVWKKIILFFILITNVVLVRAECDSYSTCVGSFLYNFFNGVNYFKNIKSDTSNNTEHGEGDINSILANVSSYLRGEWENNDTIVSHNVFQNIDNDTSVFVRAINIGEDIDFYNVLDENQTLISPEEFNIEEFSSPYDILDENQTLILPEFNIEELSSPYDILDENQTLILPEEFDIQKFTSPNNESSLIYETIVPKNITFQPLVFNFSEILAPVSFNASEFPQIKIEHYKPERDEANEISADFQEYYDFKEDNSTDYPIIDYIDLYKDTTNEIVASNSTERYNADDIDVTENVGQFNEDSPITKYQDKGSVDAKNVKVGHTVFPWIAAIFIKNDSSDQFNYYCDGALLSNKTVVTAARCIRGTNYSVAADDIIVLLGKNSLQTTNENERVAKVENIFIHENYTNGSENDLAVLSLEDEVEFCEGIQPARLGDETDYDEAYTTGWAFSGELTAIHFQKVSNCDHYLQDNNTFCAAYGNEVSVCPSYGGLYAVQSNTTWYLRGIRTADPTERAVCINRPVVFTSLEVYYAWLSQFV